IYRVVKKYGSQPIPTNAIDCDPINDAEVTEFLSEIYGIFGQYSAWKLRNMTHQDKPYREAQDHPGKEISHKSMRKHFKQYIVDDSEE
ncbi:MAG: hypothetical protein OXF47_02525, partial [Nitrospira sp.]|nr:hypothetical protein [Nitrospira sp.]